MSVLIPRNSALPSSHQELYYTASDNQTMIKVAVYQGEDIYADNNLLLGEMLVEVPKAPKGKEPVAIRFTYDINGLLVIDTHVLSTGLKKQMVFVNGVSTEVDDDLAKQMKELEKLKISPKDEEENKLLLARAESLYAQLTGDAKETLQTLIYRFNKLLVSGTKGKILKAAKGLKQYMDTMELIYLNKQDIDSDLDGFEEWFDQLEEEEDDGFVEDWGKLYH